MNMIGVILPLSLQARPIIISVNLSIGKLCNQILTANHIFGATIGFTLVEESEGQQVLSTS